MQFIRTLRERRLVQIVLSYVAGSWALLSVFDQLVGRNIVPEVAYTIVLIWCAIGLPAAILIGWHHGEKGKQTAPLSEIVVLCFLGLTAVGFSGAKVATTVRLNRIAKSQENPLELKKVAVLYFQNQTADSANQYIADGLTEGLIDELSQVQALTVVSRGGAASVRDRSLDTDSIPAIASELGAGTIVLGHLENRGDKLKVTLELLEGSDGAVFGRKTIDFPADQIINMKSAVVAQTAELLRGLIGKEVRTRESADGTTKVGAWTLLQRAERERKDAAAAAKTGDLDGAMKLYTRADSLLAEAEKVDPRWIDPIDARAAVAYAESRLVQASPPDAVQFVATGIGHAERALKLDPHDPHALEMRGTMKYYKWLLRVEPDERAAQQLFDDARSDLETAVKYQPALPTAHATLSHLYYYDNVPESIVQAQTAYTQDAYLEAAPLILWRLFNGNYEQGVFTKAQSWCAEGTKRFPDDYRFVNCRLRLLNTPGIRPDSIDVAAAWQLLARQDSLTPPARKPFEHLRGEMIVAGAIALKGQQDSARNVLNRASQAVTRDVDPGAELGVVEAYIRVLTGEYDRAVDLLTRAAAADPAGFEKDRQDIPWYWDKLRENARFRKLFALN